MVLVVPSLHCTALHCTALQVCDSLGVPLEVVPLTNEYWERVVQVGWGGGGRPPPAGWWRVRLGLGWGLDAG